MKMVLVKDKPCRASFKAGEQSFHPAGDLQWSRISHAPRSNQTVWQGRIGEGLQRQSRQKDSAKFLIERGVMHPNISRLIAVSGLKSEAPFLVFDGEYEDTVDRMLMR
ncbi:hypothetical protein GALMADRAFT_242907 [Galerina marginata CBS 339.88]|uniref:Protein kinase domain-containing protein n=1 Tax=Galerina marginata (strain CBS 339.88) TaxID=685588 RepID=A0A067TBA9_GALM3|nr:hypothetical protein GALMADRAFT_242907 [Galerina marginata CBS 339.88]